MPVRHVNETVTAVTVVTIIIIVTFVRTVKNNGIKRVAIKFEGLTVLALEGFFGIVW